MRRAAVLAVVLVMAFSGVALGRGPVATVTGHYAYTTVDWGDADRLVTVAATNDGDHVKGVWSLTVLNPPRTTYSGPVTCLTVSGRDAWLAGPLRQGSNVGAFLWIHDGGLPRGADDQAVTWISDPGWTAADMEKLCQHKATDFSAAAMASYGVAYMDYMVGLPQFSVTSGNLVVLPGR
jgi:hypothetical protein